MSRWITESPHLILREFSESDAEAYFKLGSQPEVLRFIGVPVLKSIDEARVVLREKPLRDYQLIGYGRWAMVWKESGEVIGFAGPKFLPDLEQADLGVWLQPAWWGKGLGTEASRAVARYAFGTLKLPNLLGLVDPENERSIRMLERIGMQYEGQIDYFDKPTLKYNLTAPAAGPPG